MHAHLVAPLTAELEQQNELAAQHIERLETLLEQQSELLARMEGASRDVMLTLNGQVSRGAFRRPDRTPVRFPSGLTAEELAQRLNGTALALVASDFIQAEADTGVNALFLAALAAHESSWGTSDLARTKQNLFGFTAYDAAPDESAASFASWSACIAYVARYLADEYLTPGGAYYDGGTLASIGSLYASDPLWASQILTIWGELTAS